MKPMLNGPSGSPRYDYGAVAVAIMAGVADGRSAIFMGWVAGYLHSFLSVLAVRFSYP